MAIRRQPASRARLVTKVCDATIVVESARCMHLYDLVACRAPRHGSAVRSAAKQPLGGWVLCDGTPVYTTILSLSGFITSEPGGLLRAFLQRRRCAFLKTASVLFQGRRLYPGTLVRQDRSDRCTACSKRISALPCAYTRTPRTQGDHDVLRGCVALILLKLIGVSTSTALVWRIRFSVKRDCTPRLQVRYRAEC